MHYKTYGGNQTGSPSIVLEVPSGPSRRRFLVSTASFLAAGGLRGQEEPTFKAEVKVVNLLATVRTKKGEIVRDLARDDFKVAENGRPQNIRYFSRETDLP